MKAQKGSIAILRWHKRPDLYGDLCIITTNGGNSDRDYCIQIGENQGMGWVPRQSVDVIEYNPDTLKGLRL